MGPNDSKNYHELSRWWQDILVAKVQKRLKRPIVKDDRNDLFLLAHEAKQLRRSMGWDIYQDGADTVDILERTLDKIMTLKL